MMFAPEYGFLLLSLAGFLLIVFTLTQVVLGGRKDPNIIDDETEATERFLRSVAPEEADKTSRSAFGRMDQSFTAMIERCEIKMSAEQALGVMILTGMLLAVGLYFWKEEIWLAGVGFFAGMGLIFSYYIFKQFGYRRKLQNQMPDAFFLIARSVRSGLSLEQSIDLAAQQGIQPLSSEFKAAAQQIKLGLSIPAALQRMARRIKLLDFDAFVSTIAVYARTGGNLPLLLERLAATARDHNQFRGYFFAATAQARITALCIGLAAPLLLLAYLILDPEHLDTFFRNELGWPILIGCFAMELIGAFWLYRLLKIDYY